MIFLSFPRREKKCESSVFAYAFYFLIFLISSSAFGKQPLPPLVAEGEILPDSLTTYFPQTSTLEVAFSPDGKTVATLHENKISLWDITSYRLIRTLTFNSKKSPLTSPSSVSNILSFSPDGKTLVSNYFDNESSKDGKSLLLWDLDKGIEPKVLTDHTERVNSVSFSPDSKFLASGSDDKTIKLWGVERGSLIKTLTGHDDTVNSVRFKPDDKSHILISSSKDNSVKFWDYQNGKLLNSWQKIDDVEIKTISFDGSKLATFSESKGITLWDSETGSSSVSLFESLGKLTQLGFSQNGKILTSVDSGKVKIWDTESGRPLKPPTSPSGFVYSVSFSPKNNILAINYSSDGFSLLDLTTDHLITTINKKIAVINSVSFSPDGKTVASAEAGNHSVKLWDVAQGRLLRSMEGHSGYINSVIFSPAGDLLASASADKTVNLWDTKSGALLKSLKHKHDVNSAIFSPDGKTLVSSTYGSLKLWDVATGNVLDSQDAKSFAPKPPKVTHKKAKVDSSKAKIKTRPVTAEDIPYLANLKLEDFAVDFSSVKKPPPGEMDERVLKRYADDLSRAMGMNVPYTSPISFSADGKTLASGSFYDGIDDKGIKLWTIENGKLIKLKEVGSITIPTALSFCSDGKKLASATDNYEIQLLDIRTDRLLKRFIGHTQYVNSVSFSPDCKTLVSGSSDKTIKLWDVASGRLLTSLEGDKQYGHTESVTSVSFSPDGKTMVSGANDGKVKLWEMEKRTWLKTLVNGANDNWYSTDNEWKVLRGDDGSVFVNNHMGGRLTPAIPSSAKPIAKNKISISSIPKTLELNSGKTTEFTLNVTNHSDQTLYWLQAKTATTSGFIIYPNQIYQLKPGESQPLNIKIEAELPLNVKPRTDNVAFQLTAPQLSGADEINYSIPVNIHAPQLEITKAKLHLDMKTITVAIRNQGNQEIPSDWAWQFTVNGNKLDEQYVSKAIPVLGEKELSITLSEPTPLTKKGELDLRLRSTERPFYRWEINHPISPGWWFIAIEALLLLLIGVGIYYLRGYRRPLVLKLSKQPESLLQLLPEQLSEAKTLLKKTRRLDMVLAAAGVSAETLDKAITFVDLPIDKQAVLLTQRLAQKQINHLSYEGLELYELRLHESFPLRVNDLWLCFCKNTAAEDVFSKLKNIDKTQVVTVLIGKNSEYQRTLYSSTRDLTNKLVAPQGAQLTRLLIADAESELAKIFSEQLSLRDLSPYKVGGGVDKEAGFFGRTDLVAQILNRDPANYLLVGARQVGKSTVLKAIERRLQSNPHVDCIYRSLGTKVIIPRIAEVLNLPRTEDPEILALGIRQLRQQHGRRLWLLIDEADKFIQDEKTNGYRVLNVFRRLSEEGVCNFIFAGFWDLYQHAVLDYHSPVRNFGEVLTLGALEYDACIELTTIPMAYLGISYAENSLIEMLISQCGQRANLIAMVCNELVKGVPPEQREISASDVTSALHHDKLRNELSSYEISEQEHEKQYDRVVIFATVTRTDFTLADLFRLLEDQGFNLDLDKLTQTLSRLELAFILGQEQGRWSYRVPLFVEFARQQDPDARLANVLKTWGNGELR